jgi:hypothetical protein
LNKAEGIEDIDVRAIYRRLENVYKVMNDLAKGRHIDLDMLLQDDPNSDKENNTLNK